MTVEARPSGELRLRRPFAVTAIAAVGTQRPAAEPQLRRSPTRGLDRTSRQGRVTATTAAKTATQTDRPERFHVEVSDPAEMHEFLERAREAKVRLCNRDSVRGDRPSQIHMRTDVGPFAIEELQLRCDIEASTDPINTVVGVWVTAGRAEGHSDGIAGSDTPGQVTKVAQPDVPTFRRTQDVCQISVLMDPSVAASVAAGTPTTKASCPIRFTGLRYLREVRLHYAHEDLLIANRRQGTVTAIAARWEFMHTGRFAVVYRPPATARTPRCTADMAGAAAGWYWIGK